MKWRFVNHLLGGNDPDSERVYRWHIAQRIAPRTRWRLPMDGWKRTTDDYVNALRALLKSMQASGFDAQFPVPLDMRGELLGGAHRVSVALALDIPVRVERHLQAAWAPRWDRQWFITNGMNAADLSRLDEDWKALTDGRA